MKQTPAYKNKLKALELERNGGVAKKKASKNKRLSGYLISYLVLVLLDIMDWSETLRAIRFTIAYTFYSTSHTGKLGYAIIQFWIEVFIN